MIVLSGFKEFRDKIENLPKELLEEVNGEILDAAQEWAQLAILDAPRDIGDLARGIGSNQTEFLTAEVFSNSESSAWNEWGTGERAVIPSEQAAYASEFQHKSTGGKLTAKEAIYAWAKRHGFENPWFVFRSIMIHGRYPHPYFFIQKPIVEKNFLERLKVIMTTER